MCRAAVIPLLVLAPITFAAATGQIFAPAKNISFVISTEHRANPYQEQVAVKYRITNVGRMPLYVPRSRGTSCADSMHFNAWFAGQPAGLAGSCPGPGPLSRSE